MPILNYTTKVGVSVTIGRLMATLAKHGCTEIVTSYEAGRPIGLKFTIDYNNTLVRFRLPINPNGVLAAMKRENVATAYRKPEQVERVSWRIVQDWVETNLAIIESGQVELAEAFLPYALDKENRTLFQTLQQGMLPQLKA